MIPVAPGFFRPQGGGGGGDPPGDEYECVVPSLTATFDTAGAIDGTSPEVSPSGEWTYSSASATAAGGSVSPASFSISGSGQAPLYAAYVQVNVASGEEVTVVFSNNFSKKIRLKLAIGTDASLFEVEDINNDETPPVSTYVNDNFTALSSAGVVAVYFTTSSSPYYLYVAPDFGTAVVTLTEDTFSFPTYLQTFHVDVSATGSSSKVDYIRICDYDAG